MSLRLARGSAGIFACTIMAGVLAGCSDNTSTNTSTTTETASSAPVENPQDIHGVWWITEATDVLKPSDGSAIPFTAEGQKAYDANKAGLKDGSLTDEARLRCVPDGLPRILGAPYPMQIVQTPGQTTIVHEVNHVFRITFMDGQHPSDEDALPFFMGHSVGKWEGDTLVIDTVHFNDKTFLDGTGLPHSDKLHVVERIRKINGGKQLEDVVTIEDPVMYAKPWTVRFVFDHRPDVRMEEYVCGEPNRDVSGVKRAQ